MIDATTPTALNPIVWASQLIRPMLPQVSVALTSAVLALFSREIHGWFKGVIRKRHFIIRVSAFVMLVAFGYGALNLAFSHLLSQLLTRNSDSWLFPIVLGAFIGIGLVAEERRQI